MKCFSFRLIAWEFFIARYKIMILDLLGQIFWIFFWIKPLQHHSFVASLTCGLTASALRLYSGHPKDIRLSVLDPWPIEPSSPSWCCSRRTHKTGWYLQSLPLVLSQHPALSYKGWWRVHHWLFLLSPIYEPLVSEFISLFFRARETVSSAQSPI